MEASLNIFDIVRWQPPGGDSHTWMVSVWSLGKGGLSLSDETLDFRSEGAKTPGTEVQWVKLTAVGCDTHEVAVDVDRIYAEGQILSSSTKRFRDEDD